MEPRLKLSCFIAGTVEDCCRLSTTQLSPPDAT